MWQNVISCVFNNYIGNFVPIFGVILLYLIFALCWVLVDVKILLECFFEAKASIEKRMKRKVCWLLLTFRGGMTWLNGLLPSLVSPSVSTTNTFGLSGLSPLSSQPKKSSAASSRALSVLVPPWMCGKLSALERIASIDWVSENLEQWRLTITSQTCPVSFPVIIHLLAGSESRRWRCLGIRSYLLRINFFVFS